MLVKNEKTTSISNNIDHIEAHMLDMEQADCPVAHHFGPGIYIREVTLPVGIIAIGHAQRFEHLNIMLTGKVAIVDGDQVKVLTAPMLFVAPPGRKIGYVIETCVWQNIYATDETDVEKLEAHFLDKSDIYKDHNNIFDKFEEIQRQSDRQDYKIFLVEYGITEELVRSQSDDLSDQIPMPEGYGSIVVRRSNIEGKGLFASYPMQAGMTLAPARLNGKRTPAGRYVNHAKNPNCIFKKQDNGDIYLVAICSIDGCKGGSKGTELTVNYRQALSLSGIGDFKCQE